MMGIAQSMPFRRKKPASPGRHPGARPSGAAPQQRPPRPAGAGGTAAGTPPGSSSRGPAPARGAAKGKGKGPGKGPGTQSRLSPAAQALHDRRKRLVTARETSMRDLGGLMLEMYKRNRFREDLLLDKCEEVLAIEVEIAHIDQRLFQLSPGTSAGQRPIGRCECGSPILPGQNFCGVCGRAFSTLTQPRACARCGSGLRTSDSFCAACGERAPDLLGGGTPTERVRLQAPELASQAAETITLEPIGAGVAAADGAIEAAELTPPDLDAIDTTLPSASLAAEGSASTPSATATVTTHEQGAPAAAIDAAVSAANAPVTAEELDARTAKKIAREKARRIQQMNKARARAAKERARQRARGDHGRGAG